MASMNKSGRQISKKVAGVPSSDGAGVKMRRLIASPLLDYVDPFLLLDEFRTDRPGDYIGGFPDHPHRGFETVTYMLAGRMRHGDNKGNQGLLRPGSVQWMTAGRGIIHSEMPEQENGLMWGFQLWVNLPADKKMIAPRYQDIQPEDIPQIEREDGIRIKLIAGEVDGVKGAVDGIATHPVFLDIALPQDLSFSHDLPSTHNCFVYPYDAISPLVQGMKPSFYRISNWPFSAPVIRSRSSANPRLAGLFWWLASPFMNPWPAMGLLL